MDTMTFELKDNELENVTGGTVIPYVVVKGDTLSKLAAKFHCTVQDLCDWNKDIEDPNKIEVGQVINVYF